MALDGTGCFPSYATIAEDSGLSRRSVITHVTKAVEAGMLRVTNRRNEGELNQSNIYQLVMPFGGAGDALGGERGALGGAGDSLGGGAGAAPITPQYITPQLTTPIIPKNENKKVTRNAKSQSTVTEHFGDNPICPAEYANDASRNHGFSQERIDAAFGAFYDHHASKGTKFADHRAAFRTWCRNEVKFAARGSSTTGRGVRDKAAAAVGAVVAMRYGVPSGSQSIGGGQGGDAQAEARDADLPW